MITKYKLFEANNTGLKVGDYVMLNGNFFEKKANIDELYHHHFKNMLGKVIVFSDATDVDLYLIVTINNIFIIHMGDVGIDSGVEKISYEEFQEKYEECKNRKNYNIVDDPFQEEIWENESINFKKYLK